jgi:hypothetical protein
MLAKRVAQTSVFVYEWLSFRFETENEEYTHYDVEYTIIGRRGGRVRVDAANPPYALTTSPTRTY